MLSTATPPVSVSTVIEGGSRPSSSPPSSAAETSARALPQAAETSAPEAGGDATSAPDTTDSAQIEAPRPTARDEVIDILRGGPATRQKIADELNADSTRDHVAQGPLEALLKALIDESLCSSVMLGDPQQLHYRLVEAVATPAVVLERRTRVLATIACNALSSVVTSELDDLTAIAPSDLDGLTLDGVLELGASFFGFKPDPGAAATSDLEALISSNVLVAVDDAAGVPPPQWGDADDGSEDEHLDESEGESDAAEETEATAPSDVRYTFAKGRLAEYLLKGGPALALLSLPAAVQASLRALPASEDRTAFERTAAKLLDDERDAHARTKGKLARVYEWLKEKGIDTDWLDGRLETTSPAPAKSAVAAGAKVVMRKKRVPTEKADVVRLIEELNELASEESLLPQTVKDAQDRARDLIKAAKDTAKRRGEELAALRQDKVAAAKENEVVVERRCRVEHDFVSNTVRYFDVATEELFDVEPFAAGPLFEPRPEGAAPEQLPGVKGATEGASAAPVPRIEAAPAGTPVPNGASADTVAPAGAADTTATPPAAPGFTRRAEAEAPADAAEAASRAASAQQEAHAAQVPRTGKKVAYTVQSFEAHATTVLRAAGAEGLPANDLLPRVLSEAGLTETPKGVPALCVLAEKNLKANQRVHERDGRLFWVGPAEAPAPPTPAKRGGKGTGGKAAARGKTATKARGGGRRR